MSNDLAVYVKPNGVEVNLNVGNADAVQHALDMGWKRKKEALEGRNGPQFQGGRHDNRHRNRK